MAQLRHNAVLGAATGGRPANVFTTLGRHQRLFRRWLRFAGALMPGGRLPRVDTELLILRVAHNCHCNYEWRHHERIGQLAGLSADDMRRVRQGPDAEGWTPRQTLLLRAADALHADRDIPDELWGSLGAELADADLIELCLLVGHYEMPRDDAQRRARPARPAAAWPPVACDAGGAATREPAGRRAALADLSRPGKPA